MSARWVPERRLERSLLAGVAAALLSAGLLAVLLFDSKVTHQRPRAFETIELRLVAERPPPPAIKPSQALQRHGAAPARLAAAPGVAVGPAAAVESRDPVAQAFEQAASVPALNLTVTTAMAQGARGVGTLTREDLVRLKANDPRSKLERGIDESAVPECMSTEALKHQPSLVPYVGLTGLLALPAWVKAAATGKCKTN